MQDSQTLRHSSDHLELHFVDRGGDILLITFNEMGLRANGRVFWADSLAANLDMSIAGFVTREPNWFPAPAMDAAVAVLRPVLARFKHRICLGLSQGGYAGLRYMGDVHATAVVAFSPQATIDPAEFDDERFRQYFRPDLHAGMMLADSGHAAPRYVFYDPKDRLDREHVALIRARLVVTEVPVPFIGHSSVLPFARTAIMRDLIAAVIGGDERVIRAIATRARRGAASRPYLICHALHERWPATTLRIFERYRDARPGDEWWLIGRLLAMRGFGSAVIGWMERRCGELPGNAELLACTAMAATILRDRARAVRYAREALALAPDHPTWRWVLGEAEALPQG